MRKAGDHLTRSDAMTIAAVESKAPMLVEASILIDRFRAAVQEKKMFDLEPWLADATASRMAQEVPFSPD